MALIELVSSALLGGGLVGGIAQILNTRNEARRIRAEEEDNQETRKPLAAVEAAERSVAMMSIALDKADRDIKKLEDTISRLQGELMSMRQKYTDLQQTMIEMQLRAHDIGERSRRAMEDRDDLDGYDG